MKSPVWSNQTIRKEKYPITLCLIGKIIRDIHHNTFPIISKKSERIAQKYKLSFQSIPHHKTYVVAKKIKKYKFRKEHIRGGVNLLANNLVNDCKDFNCPKMY